MKTTIKLFLASLFFATSCTENNTETTISGDIQSSNISGVKMFIDATGDSLTQISVSEDWKNYSVTVSSEQSYIANMLVSYTINNETGNFKAGQKTQTYTPIYVSPESGNQKIDLIDNNGMLVFATDDKDNRLIITYAQYTYSNLMRNQPRLTDEDILKHLSRFTEYADSLSSLTDNEEVKGFLALRSHFDRLGAISLINHRLRGSDKKAPETMKDGMLDVKSIVNSPAAKFFPREITSLVMKEIATGETLTERLANLKAEVKDDALVSQVEYQLIDKFVSSYNFSKGVDYGFAVLDSTAMNHPNYEEWKSHLQLRSSSVAGSPIPDVEIHDINGKPHSLAEYKGKYIYLDFWASWCGPCNREIPFLKELEKTLGNDNVVFVGISIDEDAEAWKEAMKRHGLSENQFLGNKRIAEMLSIQSIPRYLIYDKDGKLLNANAPRPSSGDEIRSILKNLK